MSIEPIDNLKTLLKWKDKKGKEKKYETKLENYSKNTNGEILLCHDMRGGYLPEESVEGLKFKNGNYPFMFLNWWNIDIFNYFSHHFVTIPPHSYTKIAHQHGALSLGTFITEWTPGAAICSEFLKNDEILLETVNSLVAISVYFSFDGYLINIENEIQPEKIEKLIKFCDLLTKKMRKINENSRIIWYDSVIKTGKLSWQNELNSKNRHFYESSDGIYLNYNWTDQQLLSSADYGILSKLFVGIDVWGRGAIGGFDCWKSLSIINLLHMSAAIFAPGWIYETNPNGNQIILGIDFWLKLLPYLKTRPLKTGNFSTNFCSGMIVDKNGDWYYNLSNVSIQPQFLNKTCYPVIGEGLLLSGSFKKFRLFIFDSVEFLKLKITLISKNPVKLAINNWIVEENEGSINMKEKRHFNFEMSSIQTLNEIGIITLDSNITYVTFFHVSVEN